MSNFDAGYDADGNAKTYTTRTLALAAAATDNADNIRIYYSDTNANPVWFEAEIATVKHVGWQGMLGYQKCIQVIGDSATDIWCDYAEGAVEISEAVTIQNLTFLAGYSDNAQAINIDNDDASSTGQLFVDRCKFYGCRGVFGTDYSFVRVRYCEFVGCLNAVLHQSANKEMSVTNCTAIGCHSGFKTDNSGTVNLVYNSVAFGSTSAEDFSGNWDAASDHNVSCDATAPDNGNSIRSETWGDLKFALSELDSDTASAPMDYRPTLGSSLINAGKTVAGLTDSTDIDGKTISTQPIGCSIGVDEFPSASGGGTIVLHYFQ